MKDFDVVGVIKVVLGLATPPAVFYAVGYVITKSYVASTGLNASFWFTEAFYRDAGARFILDIVQSIVLAPHLFIVVSALLIALFPGHLRSEQSHIVPGLHMRLFVLIDRVKMRGVSYALLVTIAIASLVFVVRDCSGGVACSSFGESVDRFFVSSWLFGGTPKGWLEQQPRLFSLTVLLAVAVPTTVSLGVLAYRASFGGLRGREEQAGAKAKSAKAKSADSGNKMIPHPIAGVGIGTLCLVMAAYVPIVYGSHFYDFVVVSLGDRKKCEIETDSQGLSGTTNKAKARQSGEWSVLDCYLLGRFEKTYILIGREILVGAAGVPAGTERIYVRQLEKLEPFSVESKFGAQLRTISSP